MHANLQDYCRSACADVGIQYREVPADGRWHDADIAGDPRGKGDGRIRLFADGEGGIVRNHKSGESRPFFARSLRDADPTERAAAVAARREAIRKATEQTQREQAQAAGKACSIWEAATPAPDDHPYLARKGVRAHGLRLYRGPLIIREMRCDGALIVPARIAGEIATLEFIAADGEKRFLPGGRKAGAYFAIGSLDGAQALCVAEGFATAATIHEATGLPVAVAFDAGNLLPAATALRSKFPGVRIVICGDDDWRTEGNPGATKAAAAARAVGGTVVLPALGPDRGERDSDFNDMALARGLDAVRTIIMEASQQPAGAQDEAPSDDRGPDDVSPPQHPDDAPAGDSAPMEWPEPQPLALQTAPEPYPLDALPTTIRAAVAEVAAFVKAPAVMVASSALSALSVAGQAHIDVQRAERLRGPSGVSLLTIADSGERKSTCDGFFTSAIREYENEQAEAAKPALKRYAAEFAAWAAEREGILAAIKQAGKSAKPTDKLRRELAELESRQPDAVRVPRLIYTDATPEALAWNLAKHWPSGGVLSAEGGLVFGAHGMGKDSIMRNLAMLNQLWDATPLHIDRRTSESFTVRGARLTIGLQVQELTLRSFFERSGGLARGTGFLARFLLAWPESTQGARPFTEAPPAWPALSAFHRRIAAILANPAPLTDDGGLSPAVLTLAPEAKAAWIAFHDAIEGELRAGGELYDVRDVASKTADNAARLAGLFQLFEHGMGGAIGLECFEGASRIAAWHLNEARRFFGELALPVEMADAVRLDAWLIEHCRQTGARLVSTRDVQRLGPGAVRDRERLTAALRDLEELDRLRVVHEGRRKWVRLNPALLPEVQP